MLKEAKKLGLSDAEYSRILELLGREPNWTELGIFSVMWSEHCSYKSSHLHLRKFPKNSERSLTEMGKENAGVLRLKDDWAVAFKIESHNHPSAIEPFQGAATGIGGILRDIFCMGAYPIASLDSFRFGELSDPVNRHLFDGVVRGVAAYGNCFGVPTVSGEVYFDNSYSGNPLVNVVAVGIVRTDRMISAEASGIGNAVVYIGSATGRDGIHGASFASGELTEKSQEDRPSVQIGDPFMEKLLLEATQEIAAKKLVVGMQDMGAAGLTSSSAEMAAKGGVGIFINLDKVPMREENMTPYEIMLSESQERMLLISTPENLPKIENILKKWGLHYAVIGEVIEEPVLRLQWQGKIAAEIPINSLQAGDGAPVYDMPQEKPSYLDEIQQQDAVVKIFEKCKSLQEEGSPQNILPALLAMPTVASKRWVWRQYDHQVGVRTAILPGNADAAVMRIMETGQFLALCTDCNGAFCLLNPYKGAANAVLETARNVAATGAKPIGITDCLNYGNPQKPEVMWQFAQSVDGISDACRALEIPVTGGNVSFYNESPKGAVFPTPVISMVGLIEDEKHITPMGFQNVGDDILIIGKINTSDFGGSQLQKLLFGKYFGKPPEPNIQEQVKTIEFLLQQIYSGRVESAHDISEGGIAVALAECLFHNLKLGANIKIPKDVNPLLWMFAETQGIFVVTAKPQNLNKILFDAAAKNISSQKIGTVSDDGILKIGEFLWKSAELHEIFESSIPQKMNS